MKEVWKDVKGFEGVYQISNFGRVKSFNYMNQGKESILKPKKNNKGYLWVELRLNGEKQCVLIHRLVANAFIDNSNGYQIVNHKDENPLNNTVDNLEWCNHLYNVRYSLELHPERRKKENTKQTSKYRRHKRNLIRINLKDNSKENVGVVYEYCKKNNFNEWSILQCCDGKRKTAYGYKWEFAD